MSPAPRPLRREGLTRRLVPFVAVVAVALALAPLSAPTADLALLVATAAGALALVVVVWLVPWHRLPAWIESVPALAAVGGILLLRESSGGADSGYAVLHLLPVVWLALHGTRRQVVAGAALTAVALLAPLAFGPAAPGDVRRALLFAIVTPAIGLVVSGLVTGAAAARAALRRERDFVDGVIETAGALVVVLDRGGRVVRWNRACEQLTGWSAGEMLGRSLADVVLAPDEVAAVQGALRALPAGGAAVHHEHHWVTRTGARRLITWSHTTLGDAGRADYVIGTGIDVTERRAAELALLEAQRALRASERRTRVALANMPGTLVAIHDADLRCVMVEGGPDFAVGFDRDAALGAPAASLFAPERRAGVAAAYRRALAGSAERLTFAAASGRAYELALVPLPEEGDGDRPSVLTVARDVTEQRALEERLRALADTDALTGLPNRRRFDVELERHAGRAGRRAPTGALLLVDVDHFKQVNDRLGHIAGDAAIVEVARTLRGQLRGDDLVARLGGDEFAVLLTQADDRDARCVAAKLNAAARAIGRTVSIGVAPVDGRPAQELLRRADHALYAAKQAGRDRFALGDAVARLTTA